MNRAEPKFLFWGLNHVLINYIWLYNFEEKLIIFINFNIHKLPTLQLICKKKIIIILLYIFIFITTTSLHNFFFFLIQTWTNNLKLNNTKKGLVTNNKHLQENCF